jgi:hypothetical protein
VMGARAPLILGGVVGVLAAMWGYYAVRRYIDKGGCP